MGGAGPETGVAMEQITENTRVEGYDAVRLRSASAQVDATFVPAVGMVGASLQMPACSGPLRPRMCDDGYVEVPPAAVICFEPTNALATGDRLILLEPGGGYTATFSITVERRVR
jgi:hypothetical protein